MFKRRRRSTKDGRYRIFFATDVHGSDRCFKKFLAAAKVYDAQALILGGDVGGKAIVPFVEVDSDRFQFEAHGETHEISVADLESTMEQVAVTGLYPQVFTPAELAAMREDPARQRLEFEKLLTEQLRLWCGWAEERLPQDVECLITPGNDDPFAIDAVLAEAEKVRCPEREVTQVGPIALASLGNTNRTPWDTDREFDEPELADQISEMLAASDVDPSVPLVYNFHCPPYKSGLDDAPEIDEDFRPVVRHGAPAELPVGSTAVRAAIESNQPVVGLHGHVHESAGVATIGSSVCFNPGSEYSSGTLRGLIVDFGPDGTLADYLMTSG